MLNSSEISNLAQYIRRCEIDRAVAKATEDSLDACEFHHDAFWSNGDMAMAVVTGLLVGGMVVGSMK